jgi:hypothetical protein
MCAGVFQLMKGKDFMNKLKLLLLATALITGSSVLASAEEHHDNWRNQNRYSDHDRDDRYRNNGYYNNGYYNNGYYGNGYYGDGDHDRDDGYRSNDWHRDRRWRDRDDQWRNNYRHGRDWDHDGDRR